MQAFVICEHCRKGSIYRERGIQRKSMVIGIGAPMNGYLIGACANPARDWPKRALQMANSLAQVAKQES